MSKIIDRERLTVLIASIELQARLYKKVTLKYEDADWLIRAAEGTVETLEHAAARERTLHVAIQAERAECAALKTEIESMQAQLTRAHDVTMAREDSLKTCRELVDTLRAALAETRKAHDLLLERLAFRAIR